MTTPRFAVRRLDEVPVVPDPEPGWPHWHPIRHYFGLRAFGVNLFVARAAGDRIVPQHTEADEGSAGHEELYVVLAGEVTFTIDDERFEAPAVTLVAVPDPSVRRAAIASAPGAAVLGIGAVPGRPFEVSRWDARWTSGLPQVE